MSSQNEESMDNDPAFKIYQPKLEQEHGISLAKVLGRGSYSMVYKGEWKRKEGTNTIAVKIIDTRAKGDYVSRFLPREIALVKSLNHPNITLVHDVLEGTPFVTFLCEFCEGGDILNKIKKHKRIAEAECKVHFRQLIEAMMYLQKLSIVHRDLKCENIFLDHFQNVKLGDFGFARVLREGEESKTFCGSRAYVAPEILRGIKYSGFSVDVWSCGIVLYVMATGLMPFDDSKPEKMVQRQLGKVIKFPRKVSLSTALKDAIREMLTPSPSGRPSYQEIVRLPWLRDTPYFIRSTEADTNSDVQSNQSRTSG